MIQHLLGLGFRSIPDPGGTLDGKGANGKHGYYPGFLLRIQDLQDLIKCFRGRRSLGKPVDPLFQALVSIFGCNMSHKQYILSV